MARDIVARSIDAVGVTRFRPHIDGLFGQPVECLVVGLAGLPDAYLTAIKDWDLKLHIEPQFAERRCVWILGSLIQAGKVEQGDKSRRLSEIERLCQRYKLQPRDLQVDAMADGVGLDE